MPEVVNNCLRRARAKGLHGGREYAHCYPVLRASGHSRYGDDNPHQFYNPEAAGADICPDCSDLDLEFEPILDDIAAQAAEDLNFGCLSPCPYHYSARAEFIGDPSEPGRPVVAVTAVDNGGTAFTVLYENPEGMPLGSYLRERVSAAVDDDLKGLIETEREGGLYRAS